MKRNLAKVLALVVLAAILMSTWTVGIFAADEWTAEKDATFVAVDNGVKITGSIVAYTGKTFGDETLQFNATLAIPDEKAWPCFVIRQKLPGSVFWADKNDAYAVVIKKGTTEFQKWNAGGQSTLETKANDFWKPGETHKITYSAKAEGKAVRVIFSVDGKEIWNKLDEKSPLAQPGYFGAMAFKTDLGNDSPITITNFNKGIIAEGWTAASDATAAAIDNGVKITGSIAAYTGKTFGDETLQFNATLAIPDEKAWPCFVIRQKLPGSVFWADKNDAYAVVIKKGTTEFQKWNAGGQSTLETKANDFWKPGETHKITYSAKAEGKAVRVIFSVDGKEVWNKLDEKSPITKAGSFGAMAFKTDLGNDSPVIITNFNKGIIAQGWTTANDATVVTVDNDVKINGSIVAYTGKTFGDETLQYNATLAIPDEKAWPCFVIRQKLPGSVFWADKNDAYAIVIKKGTTEFQKWNAGAQTVLETKTNNFWKPGETHKVTFSAKVEGKGVRVIFSVDGKEVWNKLDVKNPLTKAGSFGAMAFKTDLGNDSPITITNFNKGIIAKGWTAANDATAEAINKGVKITGSIVAYTGKTFSGETLKFDATLAIPDEKAWPCFVIRQKLPGSVFWADKNDAYAIVIKKGTTEFQKWNAGAQTILETKTNNFWKPGKTHKVTFSAKVEGKGVRVIFSVDGKEVWNKLDVKNPLTKAGSFGAMAFKTDLGNDSPVIITNFNAGVKSK